MKGGFALSVCALLLGCSAKIEVVSKPNETNDVEYASMSNSLAEINRSIDGLNEQLAERYFEFRTCQELLKRLGVNVFVCQSNGSRNWMEITATNVAPLVIPIPTLNDIPAATRKKGM